MVTTLASFEREWTMHWSARQSSTPLPKDNLDEVIFLFFLCSCVYWPLALFEQSMDEVLERPAKQHSAP